jgi:hypothetical protein
MTILQVFTLNQRYSNDFQEQKEVMRDHDGSLKRTLQVFKIFLISAALLDYITE